MVAWMRTNIFAFITPKFPMVQACRSWAELLLVFYLGYMVIDPSHQSPQKDSLIFLKRSKQLYALFAREYLKNATPKTQNFFILFWITVIAFIDVFSNSCFFFVIVVLFGSLLRVKFSILARSRYCTVHIDEVKNVGAYSYFFLTSWVYVFSILKIYIWSSVRAAYS